MRLRIPDWLYWLFVPRYEVITCVHGTVLEICVGDRVVKAKAYPSPSDLVIRRRFYSFDHARECYREQGFIADHISQRTVTLIDRQLGDEGVLRQWPE